MCPSSREYNQWKRHTAFSLTKIGDYAYYGNSMSSIEIPDSVESIGRQAFYLCDELKSVYIPDSVTSIGGQAFGFTFDSEKVTSKRIDDFIIYGKSGSAAEEYANEYELKFVAQ